MLVIILVCCIFVVAAIRRVDILSTFSEGVKEGMNTVIGIIPSVLLIFTSLSVFRSSGLLDALIQMISPIAELVGIPEETVPLAVMRPFSGSGAPAMLEDLIKQYGVDSRAATVGAVLCASTETTFYTLSVYLSNFSGKCYKILLCSLIADMAVIVCTGLIV